MNKELEGYFISIKSINVFQQAVTPNRNPRHELPQACRGGENTYVRFGYGSQTIVKHTRGPFSVSINADTTNVNKQVRNQQS